MKIQRATFVGVRGVADATLDFTDPRTGLPHAIVAFAGPAASGKTRLLEALIAAKEAIAPFGMPPTSAPWIGPASAAKIEIAFHLDAAEVEYAGVASPTQEAEVIFVPGRPRVEANEGLRALLDRYAHDPAYGKLEYFPANRRIPTFPPFHGLGHAEQRVQRAGKDPRKYGFVIQLLRELERDTARAARFAALLARLSPAAPTLRYGASGSTEPLPRCFSSRGASAATAAEIADGEADAVIFAATAHVIALSRSLVFVDRPELLADDPANVLVALSALGQDNQLLLGVRPAFVAELARAPASAPPVHVVTLKASQE